MKKSTIAGLIIFSLIIAVQPRQAKAQAFDEVAFLDNLSKKDKATVGDALKLFELVIGKKEPLSKDGPANNAVLKKGFISLKVANALNLTDSVVFTLFKSERYAFRACVAHGLLNADASEYDTMSGEELIEFLTLASEYKDKGASK
ncbi:MAG: hypothetical protein JXN64_08010 [Spirochaetes bacterium]|nr:hypothetical protein [Spirochaetota bacterium]